jgi:hypothetical protein
MILRPNPILLNKYLSIMQPAVLKKNNDAQIARMIFDASPSMKGKDWAQMDQSSFLGLAKEIRKRVLKTP